MLVLNKIVKDYVTGDTTVRALDDVTLAFRKNEFVSILGHSGCGKTTMLNIIGGLDKYTDGVMSIKGVTTEQYTESDWDTYRNHSIGFVFQSYNLIPHQTVLSNVELALTLSGVSKAERRKRAEDVLIRVGLGDQIHKKPNQMSGGQMQRVAIARALVNDPEILLADEPTGALDTETSVQIMDILKEISKDKLIIMVTHNPELAEQYSDRIIRLSDGKVTSDTNPFSFEDEAKEVEQIVNESKAREEAEGVDEVTKKKNKKRKPSMSFFTALSLSFNNLLTKKTRTFLTSFAGSIGIIGIALILSLSNGINAFIGRVQRETLSSYPITIQKEEIDMTAMVATLMAQNKPIENPDPNKVYVNPVTYGMLNSMLNPSVNKNNLKKFKEYLESDGCKIGDHTQVIKYGYKVTINPYLKDANNKYYKSDVADLFEDIMGRIGMSSGEYSSSMMMYGNSMWQEMLPPDKDSNELMHGMIKEQYDLVAGSWPKDKSEVVLLVTGDNTITDMSLYCLGLYTADEIFQIVVDAYNGIETDTNISYTFDQLIYTGENDTEYVKYKIIPNSDYYYKEGDRWYDLRTAEGKSIELNNVIDEGLEIKISGIIRQNPDATAGSLSGTIIYTSALTSYLLDEIATSDIVTAQKEDESKDVFTGLPFATPESIAEELKPGEFKSYLNAVSEKKRAEIFSAMLADKSQLDARAAQFLAMLGINPPPTDPAERETYKTQLIDALMGVIAEEVGSQTDIALQYFSKMDADALYLEIKNYAAAEVEKQIQNEAQAQINTIIGVPDIVEIDGERAKSIYRFMLATNPDAILAMTGDDTTGMTAEQKKALASERVTLMCRGVDNTVIQTLPPVDATGYTYPISSQLVMMLSQSEMSMRGYIMYRLAATTTFTPTEIMGIVGALSGDALKAKFELELNYDAVTNYRNVSAQSQSQERKDIKLSNELMKRIESGYYTDAKLAAFYDNEDIIPKKSPTTLEENYETIGLEDKNDPNSILIYAISFEDKEIIEDLIAEYNKAQENEADEISYTDYVGLIMSSVTSIINAITYVLVFFVSISLVVSSIMIGIITYISVLERTKEIGILRAIGASKRDISRVFNAETLIVGFTAGMIGIIVTAVLNIPIALIIKYFSGISGLASLPIIAAIALVVISMALTVFAGLIPSGIAAKKDPVESLRSE